MKSKYLLILSLPLMLCACATSTESSSPKETIESSAIEEEFSVPDDLEPLEYSKTLETAEALDLIQDMTEHKYDYTTLESGSMHVVYGGLLDNYVTDDNLVANGSYEYENYGCFDVVAKRLHIEFNYSVDETTGTSKIKGNTKNEVSFWMDDEIGYEAYHKYSSEDTDTKTYYVNEGEDAEDLEEAIGFGTCSEMITPQIDTWKTAYDSIADSSAVINKILTDGTEGSIYVSWKYNGYEMELQSKDYYMVYEKIEKKEDTSTIYYEYKYTYDDEVKVPVPTLDESWTLSE